MIHGKLNGFDIVQHNLANIASRCPLAATKAAHAGAMVVMGAAKREGFRTKGEEIGEREIKRGKNKGKKVKQYAALGKPIAGQLTSRTGMLRSSIQVIDKPQQQAAAVGPSAVYGAIHEFGGTINMPARSWRGGFTRSRKKRLSDKQTRLHAYVKRHTRGGYVIHMPARPYMRPALAKHRAEVNRQIIRSLLRDLGLK
jgi:phage gpG-like protein